MSNPDREFRGRYPKGLKAVPIAFDKIRVTLSAEFAQVSCDFNTGELEHIAAHLVDMLQMMRLTGFNYSPSDKNIDIDDEEARA